MSTKPKRKYGDIRKGAETTAGTNDSVFDKFLPPLGDQEKMSNTPPSTPPSTRASTPPSTRTNRPHSSSSNVSPQRDFQKVANSIIRDAIPAGMFNGKAKQLYDCLYSLTRGAISPSMTIRISRLDLMKKSGIGAKVTLEQNLRRLIASGLVTMKTIGGIQGGNEYTVHLPEEVISPVTIPSTPPSTPSSPPRSPSGGQKLGGLGALETRVPRYGLSVDESTSSEISNTLFKTTTNTDDESFAIFIEKFMILTEKITGKKPGAADRKHWGELADTLIAEFDRASEHTQTISSVPGFLTAHLQRRLARPVKEKITPVRKDDVGKNSNTASPSMTDEEREEVTGMITEMIASGSYTLAQAEAQFGANLSAEDWTIIKSALQDKNK